MQDLLKYPYSVGVPLCPASVLFAYFILVSFLWAVIIALLYITTALTCTICISCRLSKYSTVLYSFHVTYMRGGRGMRGVHKKFVPNYEKKLLLKFTSR